MVDDSCDWASGGLLRGSGGSSGGEASGGKTVLTFWGDWGGEGQEQIQTMVDAFNKSQDKIEVKYALQQDVVTKFLTAATNGDAGCRVLGPVADRALCT